MVAFSGGGAPPIAGLSSDGSKGIVVQGVASINSASSADDVGSTINGYLGVNDTPGTAAAQETIGFFGQEQPLPNDNNGVTLMVMRSGAPSGHVYTAPLLYIIDMAASGQPLIAAGLSTLSSDIKFRVGREGGIGLYSHAASTAPRTLAQATISAIADANALAAVQALANALSDMGALTLT